MTLPEGAPMTGGASRQIEYIRTLSEAATPDEATKIFRSYVSAHVRGFRSDRATQVLAARRSLDRARVPGRCCDPGLRRRLRDHLVPVRVLRSEDAGSVIAKPGLPARPSEGSVLGQLRSNGEPYVRRYLS